MFSSERVLNNISKLKNQKLSNYYDLLYRMLVNHFLAYRLLSTDLFIQQDTDNNTIDNIMNKICLLQPVISKMPILVDMVSIPLELMDKYRHIKTEILKKNIADKLKNSTFVTESYLNSSLAFVIEELINNKQYN